MGSEWFNEQRMIIDIFCPECGNACNNGGRGDVFHCPHCGWTGQPIPLSDLELIETTIKNLRNEDK